MIDYDLYYNILIFFKKNNQHESLTGNDAKLLVVFKKISRIFYSGTFLYNKMYVKILFLSQINLNFI